MGICEAYVPGPRQGADGYGAVGSWDHHCLCVYGAFYLDGNDVTSKR